MSGLQVNLWLGPIGSLAVGAGPHAENQSEQEHTWDTVSDLLPWLAHGCLYKNTPLCKTIVRSAERKGNSEIKDGRGRERCLWSSVCLLCFSSLFSHSAPLSFNAESEE